MSLEKTEWLVLSNIPCACVCVCVCVCMCVCIRAHTHAQSLSHVRLFATSWTIDHQAPPSIGFPRQEYWSGLPLPSPGDLPDPGIKLISPARVCCVGRQILYRLSHLRSPALIECVEKKHSCCSFKLSLVKGATCFLLPALRFFHVSWVTTLTQWSLNAFPRANLSVKNSTKWPPR